MARNGEFSGGGSRKGKPNKAHDELRQIIDDVSKKRSVNNVSGLKILVERLFELGEGIQVKKEEKDGPVIYSEPPNHEAIKTILDHRFNKATQPIERGEEDLGDQNVNVIFLPQKKEPQKAPTKRKGK